MLEKLAKYSGVAATEKVVAATEKDVTSTEKDVTVAEKYVTATEKGKENVKWTESDCAGVTRNRFYVQK